MSRLLACLVSLSALLVANALPGTGQGIAAQPSASTLVVRGTAKNTWAYLTEVSGKATVGDPKDRLTVKVKKGDLVQFTVEGGRHGVIFERSKSDQAKGDFEVVPTAGEKPLLAPSTTAADPTYLPAYYDHANAQTTERRDDAGPIITIRIKNLEPGADKGILFGCNPHSRPSANSNVMMLGVLVLDDGTGAIAAARQNPEEGRRITLGKRARIKGEAKSPERAVSVPREIVLGSMTLRASAGEKWRTMPMASAVAGYPQQNSNYVVANFSGDPDKLRRLQEAIRGTDARLVGDIRNGFVIHADRAAAQRISELRAQGLVDLVHPVTPRDKLSEHLRQEITALEGNSPARPAPETGRRRTNPAVNDALNNALGVSPQARLNAISHATASVVVPLPPGDSEKQDVRFYLFRRPDGAAPDADRIKTVEDRVKQVGGEILRSGSQGNLTVVRARLPLARVTDVAALPEVREAERDLPLRARNDVAESIMAHDPASVTQHQLPPVSLPIHGENQLVGHADTGLDTGKPTTLHPSFQGRLKTAFALGRTAPPDWSDFGGHGTHTGGSILGDARFAGFASASKLVHQSVGDSTGGLNGIPSPLGTLFEQAYQSGARVHSDSWGISITDAPIYKGVYLLGKEVDDWSWNNGQPRDMLIVIAAGNDGQVGAGSVGSPGTAKNSLTVGASENYRPVLGPFANDPDELAFFSSTGPTVEGRTRPDVVAPGTWVASVKTRAERVPWKDDVETPTGWTADPAFHLDAGDSVDGGASWHLTEPAGTAYTHALQSPPIDLSAYRAGPGLNVEFWIKGRIEPAQSLFVATRAGNGPVSSLLLPVAGGAFGPQTYNDWTQISGQIDPAFFGGLDAAGASNVRLVFVASRPSIGPGAIDVRIDHIKITTFASWGPISAAGLVRPLSSDDLLYTFDSGTSMATPLVAGAATVVRQSLMNGSSGPSAELVKGVLINTAEAFRGPRPNNRGGWGRVNIERALSSDFFLQDRESIGNGGTMTYKVKVVDRNKELRATLVWADPPGASLVNNLDLTATPPNGGQTLQAADANNHAPDTINNVEGIDVDNPAAGEWTFVVKGTSVRQGPQPFAIVVSGGIDTNP